MSKAKQVTVQAKIDGVVVFDKTVDGKGKKHDLMTECLYHMDSIGGHGTMRVQEVGARKWAVYTYEAGDSMALLDAKAVY